MPGALVSATLLNKVEDSFGSNQLMRVGKVSTMRHNIRSKRKVSLIGIVIC